MKPTSAVLVGDDIPLEFVEWVQETKTGKIIHGHKQERRGVWPFVELPSEDQDSAVSLAPIPYKRGVEDPSVGNSSSSQDGNSFASPAIIVKGSVVLKDQELQEDDDMAVSAFIQKVGRSESEERALIDLQSRGRYPNGKPMPDYALDNSTDSLFALLSADKWTGEVICIQCETLNSAKSVFCDTCHSELTGMTRKEAQDTLRAIVGAEERETEEQDPQEEQDQPAKRKQKKRSPEALIRRSATQRLRRARNLGYSSNMDRFIHGNTDCHFYHMCVRLRAHGGYHS